MLCENFNETNYFDFNSQSLLRFPAIRFAFETALLDVENEGNRILFDSDFSRGESGIKINGLVWMSSIEEMYRQAEEKLNSGFQCLKFKVGALDFETEVNLLKMIRKQLDPDIEIRLDANGAFPESEALQKLEILSEYNIHSIEQPIKPGQWESMAFLCASSPIPIALDEELIGISDARQRAQLINIINPAYIILKPSLLGGLAVADEWIQVAEDHHIDWWATSALESNIALNAIAQWAATKNSSLPQGLGTGGLYIKNFPLPLEIKNGELWLIRKELK
jgi:o-succinylbenzoate synthase